MIRFLFAFTFFVFGCSPKYYSPNSQNVPVISHQGQGRVAVAGNGDQIQLQGAYASFKNIAFQSNLGIFIPSNTDEGNGGSAKFLELGAGYFSSPKKSLLIDIYGIVGAGTMENHLPDSTAPGTQGDLSADFFRASLQPSVSYLSTYFSASASARLAYLRYGNIQGDLVFDSEDQVMYLKDASNSLLIEPALTLRGGSQHFKGILQLGHSINVTHSDFPQDDTYLTLGIEVSFESLLAQQ